MGGQPASTDNYKHSLTTSVAVAWVEYAYRRTTKQAKKYGVEALASEHHWKHENIWDK